MWELTAERLRELLIYDPLTGLFTNRIWRGSRAAIGTVTGSYDKDGYIMIMINRQKFRAGRLAFLYMKGRWPREIDHKDGVRDNNIWLNLRESTRCENVANSERPLGASGLRGVKFDSNTSMWRARVQFRGYREYVGAYDTAEEAHEAYLAAANIIHGEYALQRRTKPQPSWRRL